MYLALKHLHVACVVATLCGFVARFALTWLGSKRMHHRVMRIAPHAVDTLLLAAALGMLAIAHLNPVRQPWLLAKIVGLLAYIVFGMLALGRAETRQQRSLAFAAALVTFAYVVSVALTKNPWGFLAAVS